MDPHKALEGLAGGPLHESSLEDLMDRVARLAGQALPAADDAMVEQFREALRSRAVIEQAKGILMAQRSCTAEAAFEVLVTLSQQSNRKLRDVAQGLVDEAGGWTARETG